MNKVLSAVVIGSQNSSPVEVRRIALRALCNALGFARTIFDVQESAMERERTYIMQVVCSSADDNDNEIRRTALECIVAIVSEYYASLEPYFTVVFGVSINAVKHSDEEVTCNTLTNTISGS